MKASSLVAVTPPLPLPPSIATATHAATREKAFAAGPPCSSFFAAAITVRSCRAGGRPEGAATGSGGAGAGNLGVCVLCAAGVWRAVDEGKVREGKVVEELGL